MIYSTQTLSRNLITFLYYRALLRFRNRNNVSDIRQKIPVTLHCQDRKKNDRYSIYENDEITICIIVSEARERGENWFQQNKKF